MTGLSDKDLLAQIISIGKVFTNRKGTKTFVCFYKDLEAQLAKVLILKKESEDMTRK